MKLPAAHDRVRAYLIAHGDEPTVVLCDEHQLLTEDLADVLWAAIRDHAKCSCSQIDEFPRFHAKTCEVYLWWSS